MKVVSKIADSEPFFSCQPLTRTLVRDILCVLNKTVESFLRPDFGFSFRAFGNYSKKWVSFLCGAPFLYLSATDQEQRAHAVY